MPVTVICEVCGRAFTVPPKRVRFRRTRFCSKTCRRIAETQVHRTPTKRGYIRLTGGKMNVPEHRHVMEKFLGRKLERWEHIHHIDGDKTNNDPSNLEVTTRSDHIKDHHAPTADYGKYYSMECLQCGTLFYRRKTDTRNFAKSYCGRDCYIKAMAARTKKTCKFCGKVFNHPRADRQFCCRACYMNSRREVSNGKIEEVRTLHAS